jgi:uncharacterized repeat protein (TIGR03803 family)
MATPNSQPRQRAKSSCRRAAWIGFIFSVAYATAAVVSAQSTYEIVHEFQTFVAGEPTAVSTYLLQAADGNFYGTSDAGGANGNGTIFRMNSYGDLTTLHSFSGTDGSAPFSALIQAQDGRLYGTAMYGGQFGYGTIFSIGLSGDFTTVHQFDGTDGGNPSAALLQTSDGTFYGTTSEGDGCGGTMFAMDTSGVLVTVHCFVSADEPGRPRAPLIEFNGTLCGTSELGGIPGIGTVFGAANGDLWLWHAFEYETAAFPVDALIGIHAQYRDWLYGVTRGDGGGAIFKIDTTVDPEFSFSWVHGFGPTPNNGYSPSGPLIQASDGALYGTTRLGGLQMDGPGEGVVYKVTVDGNYSQIHLFEESLGAFPIGGVIQGNDGNLYGVAESGGPLTDGGVVYRLSNAPIAVNEVSPSTGTGEAGAGLSIFGGGFEPGVTVTIGGAAGYSITVIDSTFLHLAMPALSPGTYDVTVTSPGGEVIATHPNAYVVTVAEEPKITGFSPSFGPVWSDVTITGSGFSGTRSVTFNGTESMSLRVNPTSIVATVPPGATTGKLTVTAPGGTVVSATDFTVTDLAISSFTPTAGPVNTKVTINGTGFTGVSSVKFNGKAASFNVLSSTQLTANVSGGTTTGPITVTASGGTATSRGEFVVVAPPTVTGFTPGSGVPGTTIVVVTGTNFDLASLVTFNNTTTSSFTVNSPTQITIIVPYGATTGKIKVTNPAGAASSAASFLVPPAITSFSPASGFAGTAVTLNGKTFLGATSVTFNGVAAAFTVDTSTRIRATAPVGVTTGIIAVTTAGGTGVSATNFAVPPTITSFTPAAGPVNTKVTINGTAFTGVSSVKFNGKTASFTVLSATQLTANVSGGSTTGKITVTTPGGTATSATNFIVAVPPTVTGFTPGSGVPGTSVVITGTGFDTASAVAFNGYGASFTINSATQITATVPSSATTGKIKVTNAAGAASSVSSFLVPPTITSFSPASGKAGTSVTINGKTFTGATAVTFNGVATPFTVDTSIRIRATVPAGATTGKIKVTTPGGFATSATSFTVLP